MSSQPAGGDASPGPDAPGAGGRLLTVGIPVHDGRSLLRACLASVVGSTFPRDRYEVLVVDDGSTEPETLAILAEHAEALRDEPGFFRVLTLPTNSGGAARPRNVVLDEAVGEYVFFVDADDTIGSEALERIADALSTTPADWVALHQVMVNGRASAAEVRQLKAGVPRKKALSTLTVHKVFRRAEVERQRLRFDEGLPSGQDLSFAFSYIVNAGRFLMLGGYDYYFLTRHTGDPNEPPHLSRRSVAPGARIQKDHRILASMLTALRESTLPERERRTILAEVTLPRMLLHERYLHSIVNAGVEDGSAALRRLAELLVDTPAATFGPDELKRGLTPDHLAVVARADFDGLRDLLNPPEVAPPEPSRGLAERSRDRARHLLDRVIGRARHRRVLAELGALRRSVDSLQQSQVALEARLSAEGRLPRKDG